MSGTRIVAAGLLVVLAFGSAPLAAQGRRYGKAFLEKFSFTEAQAAKLQDIKDLRDTAWQKERALRHEINKLVHSDDYNETAVALLADQLAELTKANALAQASLTHAFYQSLDQEQRSRWATHETRDPTGPRGMNRKGQTGDRKTIEGEIPQHQ